MDQGCSKRKIKRSLQCTAYDMIVWETETRRICLGNAYAVHFAARKVKGQDERSWLHIDDPDDIPSYFQPMQWKHDYLNNSAIFWGMT